MRLPPAAVVLAALLDAALGQDGAFKSSGRYDPSVQIRLVIDSNDGLVGARLIGAAISGPKAASVKFYVDGELAGTDESEPFETRYDFGPARRRHEIVVVAFTATGSKGKRIFVTDGDARLDPGTLLEGVATAAPAPPGREEGGKAAAPPGSSPARSAGALAVSVLEPFGDLVTGAQTIVVDARAKAPRRIARVEIYVDGRLVTSLSKPPWEAPYDFGPEPRPREVKAVAYGDSGDAVSAVWQSSGAAPPSKAGPSRFAVSFVAPKPGEYLAGKVTLEVEVVEAPDSPVSRVDFFVDGSLVGTVEKAPFTAAYDAGNKVLAHKIKAYAYDRNGRRAEAAVETQALSVAFMEEVREVVLTASFADRQGRPVADLRQEEIEVREDGKREQVTGFRPESRPIVLALVIDASGSMRDKLSSTKAAAARFVDELSPQDRAIVIAFSRGSRVLQEATADKAKLKAALSGIDAETSTALYDALHLAIERIVQAAGDDRRALVVLSDGQDSGAGNGGSERSYEEVEKLALQRDVRCYAIDIARTGPNLKALGGHPFDDVSSPALRGLADQTGGEAFFVGSLGELSGTYGKVAEELRRQYWITYRPSNTKRDGKWREIEVSSTERKLIVKTRAGYYSDSRS